ncbi:hydrogenase maturation protease [bacterium]|nr:hydrogenase maturation protease [bacterium]
MDIQIKLRKILTKDEFVIIGLGNIGNGDDAAGIEISEQLKENSNNNIFDEIDGLEKVIMDVVNSGSINSILFIDAVDFNGLPGEIRLFEQEEIPELNLISTHQLDLNFFMQLLAKKQKESYLLGIQAADFGHFSPLSPEVRSSVMNLVQLLKKILPI